MCQQLCSIFFFFFSRRTYLKNRLQEQPQTQLPNTKIYSNTTYIYLPTSYPHPAATQPPTTRNDVSHCTTMHYPLALILHSVITSACINFLFASFYLQYFLFIIIIIIYIFIINLFIFLFIFFFIFFLFSICISGHLHWSGHRRCLREVAWWSA